MMHDAFFEDIENMFNEMDREFQLLEQTLFIDFPKPDLPAPDFPEPDFPQQNPGDLSGNFKKIPYEGPDDKS